jgi:radical SAM superfamily enzyme YgiQ (UPF0313 family)
VDILCRFQPDEWEILDRSGCKWLVVGAESGSQPTLDKLNKRITPEMTLEFGNLCYEFNIIPCFSMMVGLPGESNEDIEETFKLIDTVGEKVPTSELLLFLYTPYPGSSLYNSALQMGYKEPQTLEAWGEHYLNRITTPWINESLVKRIEKYNERFLLHRDIGLKRKRKVELWPCLLVSLREELSHEFLNKSCKQRLSQIKWYLKILSSHKKEYLSCFVGFLKRVIRLYATKSSGK